MLDFLGVGVGVETACLGRVPRAPSQIAVAMAARGVLLQTSAQAQRWLHRYTMGINHTAECGSYSGQSEHRFFDIPTTCWAGSDVLLCVAKERAVNGLVGSQLARSLSVGELCPCVWLVDVSVLWRVCPGHIARHVATNSERRRGWRCCHHAGSLRQNVRPGCCHNSRRRSVQSTARESTLVLRRDQAGQ